MAALRSRSIRIQRCRVRECLRKVDPGVLASRWRPRFGQC